ncbi:hypothetical protein OKW76_14625 [Sphingomonas sp. S1-29]|uniref:hypothetical protein n=1 Tax=Sphingomonas sp. S1-29 TaxID=2991074 RepID=UPI00223F671D|nr:hypothetical protein [Sphingomonas sp. S1-29]UZK69233.1 hypothetical protein OKW76_14625 [Sphingomonas sp. S1-29]
MPTRSYAELAPLVLQAPIIADATIRSAVRIKGAEAQTVADGFVRFYVNADVAALIRGPGAVVAQVGYVIDMPFDARGRTPRPKGMRVLIFARPVPGRPDQVQLLEPGAQLPWTPANDALVRQIAQAAVAPDAPPTITGIGNAFHVPGSLPGEGETQIFLRTQSGDPVSLSILRRPGEQRRWAVALGEIVDDAAGPPQRDTLLWYRLACGLPPALPEESTANEAPDRAEIARDDYAFVMQALGPCAR